MLGALNTAVSGLEQFQTELNVIGNNIANSDTTAFKTARIEFQDTFSQNLMSAGINPAQVGTGVTTGAITNDFSYGQNAATGRPGDLAIDGNGFFVVSNPATKEQFVTRDGEFQVKDGYLVNKQGYRVQGFNDTGLSTVGDLILDNGGADPSVKVNGWSIDSSGKITESLSDGSSLVRGQVLLQSFTQPQALIKEGGNLYSGIVAAGPLGGAAPVPAAPGTNGLSLITPNALEMSNVDLAAQFADLITTQRGFQANARMVTTSDEVLQEVVNLKH